MALQAVAGRCTDRQTLQWPDWSRKTPRPQIHLRRVHAVRPSVCPHVCLHLSRRRPTDRPFTLLDPVIVSVSVTASAGGSGIRQ